MRENLALDLILSRQRMEHFEGIAEDLILMPSTAEPQSNTNSESNETEQTDHQVENPSSTDGTRTRSGRVSKPPERLM